MATATRTIEPGITVLTAAEIRVAILPIGPMPKDILEEYVEVFQKHRHVPLNSTKSFYPGGQKSPFQHLPWKSGQLHFRFLQGDEARRRTSVVDLHCHRQVMAVLGLVYCPTTEDLNVAMEEFSRSSRQLYPTALVYRCCAFEPGPQHLTAATPRLSELMTFPAGHLDQHLEVYMHEFAAAVLAGIEDWVLNASIAGIKLNTYVDSGDFTGSLAQIEDGLRKLNINEEELKEKKKWGRLQKAKGDMALLAGSPRDAFEHYKCALELGTKSSDFIWCGTAVEGLAHARIMEVLSNPRGSATGNRVSSMGAVKSLVATAAAVAAAAEAGGPTPLTPREQQGEVGMVPAKEDGAAAGAAVAMSTGAVSGGNGDNAGEAGCALRVKVTEGIAEAASQEQQQQQKEEQGGLDGEVGEAGQLEASLLDSGHANDSNSVSTSLPSTLGEAATAAFEGAQEDGATPGSVPAAAADNVTSATEATATAAPAALESNPAAAAATTTHSSSSSATPLEAARAEPPSPPPTPPPSVVANLQLGGRSESPTRMPGAAGRGGDGAGVTSGNVWERLRHAEIIDEIKALYSEACNWYKKKGGAVPLQIEQQLKLARLVAALDGPVKVRSEVVGWMRGVLEQQTPNLHLHEDRLTALVEAAQVLGMVGCGRKRMLLLWFAMEQSRNLDPSETLALRIVLQLLAPPEKPGYLVGDGPEPPWYLQGCSPAPSATTAGAAGPTPGEAGGSSSSSSIRSNAAGTSAAGASGTTPSSSSSSKASKSSSSTSGSSVQQYSCPPGFGYGRNASNCSWQLCQLAAMEAALAAARQCSAPVKAWEAAAALLRHHARILPTSYQSSLIDALARAAKDMGPREKQRPGPGPLPVAELKRILPLPGPLQPVRVAAGGAGGAGHGPFIFNPNADKKARAAAEHQTIEWVCGDECKVEVLLSNPCAIPIVIDQLSIHATLAPDPTNSNTTTSSSSNSSSKGSNTPSSTPSKSEAAMPSTADTAAAAAGTQGSPKPSNKQHTSQQQQQQQQQQAVILTVPVSASLPPSGKKVKQVLSLTPLQPGVLRLHGLVVEALGVRWLQPFAEVPKPSPGGGSSSSGSGGGGVGGGGQAGKAGQQQQGPATVVVLPRMPQLKATLTGPDVHIQMPKSEDLKEHLLPDADLVDKKTGPINVFGGQFLTWTLTLTNTSNQPMASCQISVTSQKAVTRSITRGSLLNKPSGGGSAHQGTGGVTGAQMEVKQSNLAAQLPLQPGRSLTLPVMLTIGRSSSDNYEAVNLEMQISYSSSAAAAVKRRSSDDGSSAAVRRELVIPITFMIQPTLQVTHLKFLQHLVPMMGSVPVPGRQALNLQDAGLSNGGGFGEEEGFGRGPGDYTGGGFGGGYGGKGMISPRGGASDGPGGVAGVNRRQSMNLPRNSSEGSLVPGGGGLAGIPGRPQTGNSLLGPDAQVVSSPGRSRGGVAAAAGPAAVVGSPSKQPAAAVLGAILAAQQGGTPVADGAGLHPTADAAEQQNGSLSGGAGISSADALVGLATPKASSGSGTHAGSPLKSAQHIAAAKPPAAGAPIRTASEVVLDVGVRNTSERYFRTWVAKLGSSNTPSTADAAESAVVVLGPGDTARLLCALPKDAAAVAAALEGGKGPSGRGGSEPQHEVRLWGEPPPKVKCGEVLVRSLGVMWEMITGDAGADKMPWGQVALNAVDAARSMNASAMAALCPSEVGVSFRVKAGAAGGWPQVEDLATLRVGVPPPNMPQMLGQLWGVAMQVGQMLPVQLQLHNRSTGNLTLRFSLGVVDLSEQDSPGLYGGSGSMYGGMGGADILRPAWDGGVPSRKSLVLTPMGENALGLPGGGPGGNLLGNQQPLLINPGVIVTGLVEKVQVELEAGGTYTHGFSVMAVLPGYYQLGVVGLKEEDGEALYYSQDQLLLACSSPQVPMVVTQKTWV